MGGHLLQGRRDQEEVGVVAARASLGRDPVGEGHQQVASQLELLGLHHLEQAGPANVQRLALARLDLEGPPRRHQLRAAARAGQQHAALLEGLPQRADA